MMNNSTHSVTRGGENDFSSIENAIDDLKDEYSDLSDQLNEANKNLQTCLEVTPEENISDCDGLESQMADIRAAQTHIFESVMAQKAELDKCQNGESN